MPLNDGLMALSGAALALLAFCGLAFSVLVLAALHWRRQAAHGRRLAGRSAELRAASETLRDADDPLQRAATVQQALQATTGPGGEVTLLLLRDELPVANDPGAVQVLAANACPTSDDPADILAGLWLCLRENHAFGPGTGRHEQQGAWYLPMRGRSGSLGAARLWWANLPQDELEAPGLRTHAQALCDEMGQALQRAQVARAAAQAREAAQTQALRNTLLAAISHDFRTPLATILGAASTLAEQAEKLSIEQRRKLAGSVVLEAEQLSRLTDNALQLARLDTPGLALRTDWESAEEMVGAVLRRLRPRDPQQRLRARVEPGLPLLRCDAVLMVQMLDNLLDNALQHGGSGTPVEVLVRRVQGEVLIAVRDRGPGVPPAWRGRIFDVFQRGDGSDKTRGAGVGLAVCSAIARAHGSELVYRPRGHGGASFESRWPVLEQPAPAKLESAHDESALP